MLIKSRHQINFTVCKIYTSSETLECLSNGNFIFEVRIVVYYPKSNGVGCCGPAISVYHYSNPAQPSCILYNIVIKFVSHLRQVRGFLRVLLFPPPIKRTVTIYLKYC